MHDLLKREMDRAEFLKLLGLGALSLFGLGSFLKAVMALDASGSTKNASLTANPGYNNGLYAGSPKGKG